VAVTEVASEQGLTGIQGPENLEGFIQSQFYEPNYRSYGLGETATKTGAAVHSRRRQPGLLENR
jgi:hypothetical protein